MEYHIESLPQMRVAGVRIPLENDAEKNFRAVPDAWAAAAADGTLYKLGTLMNCELKAMLGVCHNSANGPEYYIAAATTLPVRAPLTEFVIPACTWAIFEGCGPVLAIQQLEQRIFNEWLPSSGYRYAGVCDVEVYHNADPSDARFEVRIPVEKE